MPKVQKENDNSNKKNSEKLDSREKKKEKNIIRSINKVLIGLALIIITFLICMILFFNFSGNTLSKEFDKAEQVSIEEEYKTYTIGTNEVGYLQVNDNLPNIANEEGINIYQKGDRSYFMINLNYNNQYLSQLTAGDKDVYTSSHIDNLPEELNSNSRLVLNNLYNNHYLVEKLLIGENNRSLLVSGTNISGTLGDILKTKYNQASKYEPFYCFFGNNTLIIVLDSNDEAVETLSSYHISK